MNNDTCFAIITAKKYFLAQFEKNYSKIYNLLKNDNYLLDSININILQLSTCFNDIQNNNIFNLIFSFIKQNVDKKYIHLLCKIYLHGELGNPNSLENKGRFLDSIQKYYQIPKSDRIDKKQEQFNSLDEIDEYIETKKDIFFAIEDKNKLKINKKLKQLNIKEEGINDVQILFHSNKVIIYYPISEAGSKYYGRNTRWCTASENDNMFDYYTKKGPLFIIELKNKFDENNYPIKFQIHIETFQFMDNKDLSVTIDFIKNEVKDELFNLYITNIIKEKLYNYKHILEIYNSDDKIKFDLLPQMINLEQLILGETFNLPAEKLLLNLTNLVHLKALAFYNYNNFNEPLGNYLSHFHKLEILCFYGKFNQLLGNSLSKLTNLKSLVLEGDFNQPLENSLLQLTNLEFIKFGKKFNQSIDNKLTHLTKLKQICISRNYESKIQYLILKNEISSNVIFDWL